MLLLSDTIAGATPGRLPVSAGTFLNVRRLWVQLLQIQSGTITMSGIYMLRGDGVAVTDCATKTCVRAAFIAAQGGDKPRPYGMDFCSCLLLAALLFGASTVAAWSAEDLRLRDGISFYQDIDSGFPIIGQKMDDVAPAADRPTFIFFGAAGDLNTNRQARRVVDIYRRYRESGLKFVIVDVDQPAGNDAKQLIREHYKGYIPFEVILDRSRQKKWSHTGEVEGRLIQTQLDRVLAGDS